MRFSLEEISLATSGEVLLEPKSGECTVENLTWDSRSVLPNSMYVAIVGSRVDGHKFLADAACAGAVCMLVSAHPAPSILAELEALGAAVVLVADTQEAICALASAWRKQLNCNVVGITGSSGKTTTKNFVRDVLERAGSVCATSGNQNNELGLPATVLCASKADKFLVCEMGMRGSGQIASLCKIAKPTLGVITNIGTAHIDILGSEQAIAHAKAELFEALPQNGYAFVNVADSFAEALCNVGGLKEKEAHIVAFDGSGREPNALAQFCVKMGVRHAVWVEKLVLNESGCASFTLCATGFSNESESDSAGGVHVDKAKCTLALAGKHNASNACAAAAVGMTFGISLESIVEALEATQPESGREQVIHTNDGIKIFDGSYNANPASVLAALNAFAAAKTSGRRIAVLGSMAELGDTSAESHIQVGRQVAALPIGVLVCVGTQAQNIAKGALEHSPHATVIIVDDAHKALEEVKRLLKPGDAVLVKASRCMQLDVVVEGLV